MKRISSVTIASREARHYAGSPVFFPPGCCGYALLETKGRKTGKPRRTPVGEGRIGNQFWLVAEHGMKAGYVRNIERDPHVRLKLREGLRYHLHTGTVHLLSDDDPRERQPGWRVNCRAPGARGRCASSGRNSSPFGLIWKDDKHRARITSRASPPTLSRKRIAKHREGRRRSPVSEPTHRKGDGKWRFSTIILGSVKPRSSGRGYKRLGSHVTGESFAAQCTFSRC
jgi:deazaflavin-dependent oxidoreductase (nitroreductase family)